MRVSARIVAGTSKRGSNAAASDGSPCGSTCARKNDVTLHFAMVCWAADAVLRLLNSGSCCGFIIRTGESVCVHFVLKKLWFAPHT